VIGRVVPPAVQSATGTPNGPALGRLHVPAPDARHLAGTSFYVCQGGCLGRRIAVALGAKMPGPEPIYKAAAEKLATALRERQAAGLATECEEPEAIVDEVVAVE
jgi:hypothetical protein